MNEEQFLEKQLKILKDKGIGGLARIHIAVIIRAAIEYGKEVERAENIKLSDDIETRHDTSLDEWRAFKNFRNTLRDKSLLPNHQS